MVENNWLTVREAAELSETTLSDADLSEANLSGADLTWADLRWTDLRWTSLSGAKYDNQTQWLDGFDPEAAGAFNIDL